MRRITSQPTGPTGDMRQVLGLALSWSGVIMWGLFAVAVVGVGLWKVVTTVIKYVLGAVLLLVQ